MTRFSKFFCQSFASSLKIRQIKGATANVDFNTRSALSRKLANHAAKKNNRAEKSRATTRPTLALCMDTAEQFANNKQALSNSGLCTDIDEVFDIAPCPSALDVVYEADCNRDIEKENGEINEIMSHKCEMNSLSESDEEFFDALSEQEADDSHEPGVNMSSTDYETRSLDKVRNSSNLQTLSEVNESLHSELTNSKTDHGSSRICSREVHFHSPSLNQTSISFRSSAQSEELNLSNANKSGNYVASVEKHPFIVKLSPINAPDLRDIQNIVHQQETELWEEMRQKKSSTVSESGKSDSGRDSFKSVMAASRSFDHTTERPASSIPILKASYVSRLPQPVRRAVQQTRRGEAVHSRFTAHQMSQIGATGGSTPSLNVSNSLLLDESLSECGGQRDCTSDQPWNDECF